MSEVKNNIYKSLAEFQQECPIIHKGTKSYGYSYADLPTIFEIINPILKSKNLGFTQLIESQSIRTVLFHVETGEKLESVTDIPQDVTLKGMNDYQVLGSAITYLRRYALSAMLGIVTDKDTDANGQQKKSAPKKVTKLPLCNDEKFDKYCEAIRTGKKDNKGVLIDVDYLKARHTLTDEQQQELANVNLTV